MNLVRRVESKADLARFIHLPHDIYRGDCNWVPPLRSDVAKVLTPGRNPYWEHARRELYLAERGGRTVGRIAAIVDDGYNRHRNSTVGFFGFFECTQDAVVAKALFDAAFSWCVDRGMTSILGPCNPSINDEAGLLIDAFDRAPYIKTSYNPPFYARLIEEQGLTYAKDLLAYSIDMRQPPPEKVVRVMEKLKRKHDLVVRPLDLRNFESELTLVKEIYNDAWGDNWDFVPMTDAEVSDYARQLRPILRPEICPMVLFRGEAIGMSLSLPDYNQVLARLNGSLLPLGWLSLLLNRKRITRGRLWALGIKRSYRKLGLDSLLYYETFMGGRKLGYDSGEMSWVLEDNTDIIRPIALFGGTRYKTYRVYSRDLKAFR